MTKGDKEKRKVKQIPGDMWREMIRDDDGEIKFIEHSIGSVTGEENTWVIDHITASTDDVYDRYVPIRKPPWLLPPKPIDYENENVLWVEVMQFIHDHVDLPDIELYTVCAAWVFCTWVPELWYVIPYPIFTAPIDTGKTRALETLQRISFRGTISPNYSTAVIYNMSEKWKPTLFIDEMQLLDTESRKDVIGLLNAGYKRGQYAYRMMTNSDGRLEITAFDVFGFKALAGTGDPQPSILSRGIPIKMKKNVRKVEFFIDEKKATELRGKLLMWRFRRLHREGARAGKLKWNEGNECSEPFLREVPPELMTRSSRTAELFHCLYTVMPQGREDILKHMETTYESKRRDDETSTESEIIRALLKSESYVQNGKIATRVIAEKFNEGRTEKEQWKTSSVGRRMSALGFEKGRVTDGPAGWVWDEDRITDYCLRYYIDRGPPGSPSLHSLGSFEIKLGDFYPIPLRQDFTKLGKNPPPVFEKKILEYAPDWPDFKVQALLEWMIERGELMQSDDGELIPVA